ncbi:MAG TPA: gamma-glutamyltransferase [Thermoplasmata archaeon]|nr:gamma-glutamyltransferase [Thermoplasmata archaeon]
MENPGGVATAHPISTAIGRSILRRGGNAYDAALAVSAALPVVLPQANGLGSDLFAVIRDRSVETLNASGPAAELATPERFESVGLQAIPDRGPLSSFTVPGIVAAWSFFAARATMRFSELLQPAIRLARQGIPVTPLLAAAIAGMPWSDSDWQETYRGHAEGDVLHQVNLAATLEEIAGDSGHGFYHGPLARKIERDMIEKGGLLRFGDLDGYEPACPAPLRSRYRGYDVYTTPPNSQGATALYWLARLERYSLGTMSPREYVATLIATMYPAYQFRAEYIGDPDRHPLPRDWLAVHPRNPRSVSSTSRTLDGRDTTAFSVFDGAVGLTVIQSNYQGFGSGHTIAGTGINLNDRGSYFTLDRAHHNAVAPRKKTFHTLMVTAAVGPDLILLGSMGGDVQPQVNVQVLTNVLDRGLPIQSAIDAPRFAYPASIYGSATLIAEPGRGVSPPVPAPAYPSEMGHCQGIQAGAEVAVGIDPRGEGRLPIPRLEWL